MNRSSGFKYYNFGSRKDQFLIQFGVYEILLKVVRTKNKLLKSKEKHKEFTLIISDGPTTVRVRGFPSLLPPLMDERNYSCDGTHKPEPAFEKEYNKNRAELLSQINEIPEILEFGKWTLEDVDNKGFMITQQDVPTIHKTFNTLMELFCHLSPQDANELGPEVEDFIREKFYTPIYNNLIKTSKQPEKTASILDKLFKSSVRVSDQSESVSKYTVPSQTGPTLYEDQPEVTRSLPEAPTQPRPAIPPRPARSLPEAPTQQSRPVIPPRPVPPRPVPPRPVPPRPAPKPAPKPTQETTGFLRELINQNYKLKPVQRTEQPKPQEKLGSLGDAMARSLEERRSRLAPEDDNDNDVDWVFGKRQKRKSKRKSKRRSKKRYSKKRRSKTRVLNSS